MYDHQQKKKKPTSGSSKKKKKKKVNLVRVPHALLVDSYLQDHQHCRHEEHHYKEYQEVDDFELVNEKLVVAHEPERDVPECRGMTSEALQSPNARFLAASIFAHFY